MLYAWLLKPRSGGSVLNPRNKTRDFGYRARGGSSGRDRSGMASHETRLAVYFVLDLSSLNGEKTTEHDGEIARSPSEAISRKYPRVSS